MGSFNCFSEIGAFPPFVPLRHSLLNSCKSSPHIFSCPFFQMCSQRCSQFILQMSTCSLSGVALHSAQQKSFSINYSYIIDDTDKTRQWLCFCSVSDIISSELVQELASYFQFSLLSNEQPAVQPIFLFQMSIL